MTLRLLFTGLIVWLMFLVACIVWAWVKLGRQYDSRIVHVLPVATVLICVSLILFFILRALLNV